MLEASMRVCDAVVYLATKMTPTPRVAAVAIAMALGRICEKCGMDSDAFMALARVSVAASAAERRMTH